MKIFADPNRIRERSRVAWSDNSQTTRRRGPSSRVAEPSDRPKPFWGRADPCSIFAWIAGDIGRPLQVAVGRPYTYVAEDGTALFPLVRVPLQS